MPPVVHFDNVSKLYQIGSGRGSLREALSELGAHVFRRRTPDSSDANALWALKDVSFDLEAGQVLGIMGRNGAGKTTALKLLSRVTKPTEGQVSVNGRVSALIELGAGFHPDLTGRENIYLNGAILGLSRKEIDRKFDSIVAFAELERFIDTPVKRYSSGMYARLGFAVAAYSDPDVLLVDEVLAVGDLSFQTKCFDFIYSFVTHGKTAVFVSHNMYVLEQLCSRLIWLDHGQIAMSGEPGSVLSAYLDAVDKLGTDAACADQPPETRLRIGPVSFSDGWGNPRDHFATGEDMVVGVQYDASEPIDNPHFSFGVVGPSGGAPLFKASMLIDGTTLPVINGPGVVKCRFRSVPLMPRTYSIWGEVWSADRRQLIVPWQRLGAFRIRDGVGAGHEAAGRGAVWQSRADAPINVPHEWDLQIDSRQHAARR